MVGQEQLLLVLELQEVDPGVGSQLEVVHGAQLVLQLQVVLELWVVLLELWVVVEYQHLDQKELASGGLCSFCTQHQLSGPGQCRIFHHPQT